MKVFGLPTCVCGQCGLMLMVLGTPDVAAGTARVTCLMEGCAAEDLILTVKLPELEIADQQHMVVTPSLTRVN